jgi:hypothetical protein
MATFRKGILGSFSGTVGPVVGATYRGQDVLRSRPRKSTKPATDLQMMQRRKFGKAVQFITPAKMIIADYFGSAAGVKSRFNLATSYYISNVISYENEEAVLDYSKGLYAKGNLLNTQSLVCQAYESAKLVLTWLDNSNQADTKASDDLMVVVVDEETESYEFFLKVAKRNALEVVLDLPNYLGASKVHVYGFMVSEDEKVNSTSQYLGQFEVL